MKNILIVWDGDYPWDVRVDKECDSLLDAGYSVHIVARNTKQQTRIELFRGAMIHRLPKFPTFLPAINKTLSFPFFFNPVWLWNIYKVAKKYQCSVIIVRDLPLAISGIVVSKLLYLPMLLDMAECYPELLRASNESREFSIVNFLVRNPALAEYVESYATRRSQHIFVMVEEAAQYLEKKGIDRAKTVIVSNTPVLEKFKISETRPANGEEVKMIYVGLVSKFRGLHHVISAMEKIVVDHPELRLVIVGSGGYVTDLESLVKEKSLERYVEFTGWVDNSSVPQLINDCDIGLVPHKRCSHSDTTVPNKLFDYMAAGKPVIVSDARPLDRIVSTEECGLVFADGDIDALANSIITMMDKSLRTRFGKNGRVAIEKRYNWKFDRQQFIDTISMTIKSMPAKKPRKPSHPT